MTLLRDTLTGIIGAFNSAQQLQTVPLTVSTYDGRASFDLVDHLPAGAHSIVVSSVSPRSSDIDVEWHLDAGRLNVVLRSKGRHYASQPLDTLARPATLDAVLAFVPAPLDVPDLDLDGLHHFGVSLPARLEHVVEHGMGKTRFIERITDAQGRAQFAAVEAVDANRVRVMLAEALPVRLDMIFLPVSTGSGV